MSNLVAGVVPKSWTRITGVYSTSSNLTLLEEINRLGIDHNDLKKVEQVWIGLVCAAKERIDETEERGHLRKQEAIKDSAVVKELEQKFPSIYRKG